jgi:hypothetical protein
LSRQNQASGELQLGWADNSDNEDGFKIERKTGTTGTYSQVALVGANFTAYTDTNLIDGAIYCYRMAAFNAAGTSAYTLEECAAFRSTIQQIFRIGIFALALKVSAPGQHVQWMPVLCLECQGMFRYYVITTDAKVDVAVYRNGDWLFIGPQMAG